MKPLRPGLRQPLPHEELLAVGYPLLTAAFLGLAAAGGATVDWSGFGAAAAAFAFAGLGAHAAGRRGWIFALPVLGTLPPFLVTPAPALIWATYAATAVGMVVLVLPGLVYGVFLAALPVGAWALARELGAEVGGIGAPALAGVLAFSAFRQLSNAIQYEGEKTGQSDSYAQLVRLRVREPIDAELRESLGGSIMAVAAACRLALAADAAGMRERLAAADAVSRWGLERLRVTSRALRNDPVEPEAVAGFLRNATRGLLGNRLAISMQSEVTAPVLPPEAAYGMAALVFDMLEAARVSESVATVGIYCDDAGFTLQLRRPAPEFAVAQTREWTGLRRRAARMSADFTVAMEGGRMILRVAGPWPSGR